MIQKYQNAIKASAANVVFTLANTLPEAGVQEIVDKVLYTTFLGWDKEFLQKIKPQVQKWTAKLYKEFRTDKAIFGDANNIPSAKFSLPDTRAMEFYAQADNFYLGKFITDPDTKKKVADFIADEYLKGGGAIGRDSASLQKFKEAFTDVLAGEDWKIRRIVDTSVNRMRSSGSVQYMRQAGVETFKIVGVMDRLTCPYCESMHGRHFSVTKFAEKVDTLSFSPDSLPDQFPFITGMYAAEDLDSVSIEELESKGIGLPPFHPHCRDSIVAVLHDAPKAEKPVPQPAPPPTPTKVHTPAPTIPTPSPAAPKAPAADPGVPAPPTRKRTKSVISDVADIKDVSNLEMPENIRQAGYTDDLFKAINDERIDSPRRLRDAWLDQPDLGVTQDVCNELEETIGMWKGESSAVRKWIPGMDAEELRRYRSIQYAATKFDSGEEVIYRGFKTRLSGEGSSANILKMCRERMGQCIEFGEDMQLGGSTYDMTMLSGSRNEAIARTFANMSSEARIDKVILKIENKRKGGIKGFKLTGDLSLGKEDEVIFGDSFKYRVKAINQIKRTLDDMSDVVQGWEITLEQLAK